MTYLKQHDHVLPGFATDQRLRAFAHHVVNEQYDIVCVQEVFVWRLGCMVGDNNFVALRGFMMRAGLVYHSTPSAAGVCGQNSGVAIFSRHPLVRCQCFRFEHSAEWANRKGFVVADAQLGSRIIRVVSAHLDARDWVAKKTQLAQIAKRLDALEAQNPATSVLVCGDFNCCPQLQGSGGFDDGQQYAFMEKKFRSVGLTDLWSPDDSVPTEGGATLDHIFVDSDTQGRVRKKEVVAIRDSSSDLDVSDH